MYERRHSPPLPRKAFFGRLVQHGFIAFGLIAAALGIGILGYHFLAGLEWIDALVNASMILGGMGPVDPVTTLSGKLFASFYALFSGVVFIGLTGILLAPIAHRLIHKFHWEEH